MGLMEFIQSLAGDEFLSKSIVLGSVMAALTTLVMYAKGIPKAIWARIRRLIIFSVTIEQTDELFEYMERWLKDKYQKKQRNVLAHISYKNFALNGREVESPRASEPDVTKKEEVTIRHREDIIFLRYNGVRMKIFKGRDKLENAKSLEYLYFDRYVISAFFFKKKIISLLGDIVEYNQQFKEDAKKLSIFVYNGYQGWIKVRSVSPKRVENIVLEEGVMRSILDDISMFTKKKDWYTKRSIPYKRGYLFHGAPGNGKTSMALALADYLAKDIYVLPVSEISDDHQLKESFRNMGHNTIVLLEDMDAAFDGRKSKSNISLSAMLNCLDGVYYKEGVITIMTTNHPKKLDPALIRDGRVDMKVDFTNPGDSEVKRYVEMFYEIRLNGEVYSKKDLSMATIQNICLKSSENEIKEALFSD